MAGLPAGGGGRLHRSVDRLTRAPVRTVRARRALSRVTPAAPPRTPAWTVRRTFRHPHAHPSPSSPPPPSPLPSTPCPAPHSFTPGCTAQACAFRDAAAAFSALDAEVVGISGDTAQGAFKAAHRLPFRLIGDAGGRLRALYAVPATLWVLPGRVTYVIDAGGRVVRVISAALDVASHVAGARAALEAARGGDAPSTT